MIGWLDCASGVSGDMVLGALVGAGAELSAMQQAVDAVVPGEVRLRAERVTRSGIAATKVHVDTDATTTSRRWADIQALLNRTDFPGRPTALAAFSALAQAEAVVHGIAPDAVHFHEVGALDSIADVVAAANGFAQLGLERLTVSPIAVGSGTVSTEHGRLPVPAPAVVHLLRGRPTYGGSLAVELTTPTGAALIVALCSESGPQPLMNVTRQGTGAGDRDPAGHPNIVRLLVGETAPASGSSGGSDVVLEANVDDLDPRIWPGVLQALLAVGADDAWLVPMLMKKGRPAHVLHVLAPAARIQAVEEVVFTQTSTLGVRSYPVNRTALHREVTVVDVDGERIRVKLGLAEGRVVNAQPEWEDVAAASAQTGVPVKLVLARASAAYWNTVELDIRRSTP